ncbi:hypothetical protein CRYUN_Cryun01aG0008100 [Craigia yunnanensis]
MNQKLTFVKAKIIFDSTVRVMLISQTRTSMEILGGEEQVEVGASFTQSFDIQQASQSLMTKMDSLIA